VVSDWRNISTKVTAQAPIRHGGLDKTFAQLQKAVTKKRKVNILYHSLFEGKIYNVKLRFLPKVADNVTEIQWHSTQKVTRNNDGSATIEFRVDGLGEISWWILGYGDQVQVLAPKALRGKVLKTAKNMVKLNS